MIWNGWRQLVWSSTTVTLFLRHFMTLILRVGTQSADETKYLPHWTLMSAYYCAFMLHLLSEQRLLLDMFLLQTFPPPTPQSQLIPSVLLIFWSIVFVFWAKRVAFEDFDLHFANCFSIHSHTAFFSALSQYDLLSRDCGRLVRAEVGSELEIPTDLEGLTDSFVHLVRQGA